MAMRQGKLPPLATLVFLVMLLLAGPGTSRADGEPVLVGPDFEVPPPQPAGEPGEAGAPSNTQTSEFMAGTIVYSVVFVDSAGGAGYCSPADSQSENWDGARQSQVLQEIQEGAVFWTSRLNGPVRSFVLDN